MRSSYLALAFGAAVATASCSVYDSSLLLPGETGGKTSGTGGSSGGNGSGGVPNDAQATGGVAGCDHVSFPRKTVGIEPSKVDKKIVVVMRSIDFGDRDPVKSPSLVTQVGFDLDGVCSAGEDGSNGQCSIPKYGSSVPDGPRGQDNAIGQMIQYVRQLIEDFSSDHYTEQLEQGGSSVLIRVTGYNGQKDDDQVTLENFVTAPFNAFTPKDPEAVPAWNGDDAWPVSSLSVANRDVNQPLYVDTHAYVTNGKLVAGLPKFALRLTVLLSSLGNVDLDLNLTGTYVVCDIADSAGIGEGYTLKDCTLAARWSADDLIHQLSHFPEPLTSTQAKRTNLCPATADTKSSYAAFKGKICSLVDVTTDGLGTTTPCDALSMGVKFQTYPAQIGSVFPINPVGELCEASDAGVVLPSQDSCASLDNDGTGAKPSTGGTASTGGRTSTGGTAGSGGTGSGGVPNKDAGPDGSSPDASQ